MITEKELYDWLKPIAKWGDILTFDEGRVLINTTMGGFQLTTEDTKSPHSWYLDAWSVPFTYHWSNLRLWRCKNLPSSAFYSKYQCAGPDFNWKLISTYEAKEKTVTISRSEYDKLRLLWGKYPQLLEDYFQYKLQSGK